MSFQISSVAFSNGDTIPKKFTCDGPDVSPQSEMEGGTRSDTELCAHHARSGCARRYLGALGVI